MVEMLSQKMSILAVMALLRSQETNIIKRFNEREFMFQSHIIRREYEVRVNAVEFGDEYEFKTKTRFYCNLCKTSFATENGALKHMKGKNHTAIMAEQKPAKKLTLCSPIIASKSTQNQYHSLTIRRLKGPTCP
jgi:hypothetical protein